MKKGFTIIELLTTLVILALLALISVPAIQKNLANSKNQAYSEQKNRIVMAAKKWGMENIYTLPETSKEEKLLTIEDLKKEGYLEKKDIINPVDGKAMNGCVKIKFIDLDNQYTYEYQDVC